MGPCEQRSYSEDETDHGKGIGRLGLPESIEKWILRFNDISLLAGFGPILSAFEQFHSILTPCKRLWGRASSVHTRKTRWTTANASGVLVFLKAPPPELFPNWSAATLHSHGCKVSVVFALKLYFRSGSTHFL